MKRYLTLASLLLLSLSSCKDNKQPGAPGEPLNDTVTVDPPRPHVPEKDIESRERKVEVEVPAPPPPPKPGQLPPPPPPPPKIKVK